MATGIHSTVDSFFGGVVGIRLPGGGYELMSTEDPRLIEGARLPVVWCQGHNGVVGVLLTK